MAHIRISLFGGIIPRLADRGLPDNAAQFALNAKLYSGELRAWSNLNFLAQLPISDAKTVYHYRDADGEDQYLAFNKYTNVVKAPLVNETLGRLYYSNDDGVFVTTSERIANEDPPFKLGMPKPEGTFTVTPSGGDDDTAETRAYVVISVSAFGEESAPSRAVLADGNADGTWTITGLDALTLDPDYAGNVTHLRLYRTISSNTGADYRMVDEWEIDAVPSSYDDEVTAEDLADNPVLQSLGWLPPPQEMRGLIGIAGGFMAGFVDRTVRLSVPYHPHAWPEDYQFAVEDKIVGLGTFGNTIVVCTEGRAALLIGLDPESMSLSKLEGVQPCLSARGIVSTVSGVMYPSTDGLVLVDASSNSGQIISRAWVTKNEWMNRFSPATQMSSVYQDRYFSFYNSSLGFTVGFDDPVTGFTELQLSNVSSVDLDPLTGQTLITIGDSVYEWDGAPASTLYYQWLSKPFLTPKPVNFGAIQLRGTFGAASTLPPDWQVPDAVGYALNSYAIGVGGPPSMHLGGSINGPAFWQTNATEPTPPGTQPGVAVKVYADGTLRWIGNINTEVPRRLPSGYKAVRWEVELLGTNDIYSITLSETLKELERLP